MKRGCRHEFAQKGTIKLLVGVNKMKFRSELLQAPQDDSEATITKIYDVYRTPAGSIQGEGESIAEVLENGDASIRKDFRPKSF